MAKPRVSITCRRVNRDWRLARLPFLAEQTVRHSHQPLRNVRFPLIKIVKITVEIAFPSIKAYNIDKCGATAEKTRGTRRKRIYVPQRYRKGSAGKT